MTEYRSNPSWSAGTPPQLPPSARSSRTSSSLPASPHTSAHQCRHKKSSETWPTEKRPAQSATSSQSITKVNPSQVPHHGRLSFAPWAFGYIGGNCGEFWTLQRLSSLRASAASKQFQWTTVRQGDPEHSHLPRHSAHQRSPWALGHHRGPLPIKPQGFSRRGHYDCFRQEKGPQHQSGARAHRPALLTLRQLGWTATGQLGNPGQRSAAYRNFHPGPAAGARRASQMSRCPAAGRLSQTPRSQMLGTSPVPSPERRGPSTSASRPSRKTFRTASTSRRPLPIAA